MRTKANITAIVLVAIGVLTAAGFCVTALRDSAQRLAVSQQQLSDASRDVRELIQDRIEDQERFLIETARQDQPSQSWVVLKQDLYSTFTRFVGNPNFQVAFSDSVAAASLSLGQLHAVDGNFGAAIESLGSAIELATDHGDAATVAVARNSLGCAYTAVGKYEPALREFHDSARLLAEIPGESMRLAISLRNIASLQRILGKAEVDPMIRAARLLNDVLDGEHELLDIEILIDTNMELCELLWLQGRTSDATIICNSARDLILDLLNKVDRSNIGQDIAQPNRYLIAVEFAERNLSALRQGGRPEAWQWKRLVDLTAELVPDDLAVAATMAAEFEPQSGLLLAWSTLESTHSIAINIAKLTCQKVQLIVLADNPDSLEEARSRFAEAGIPADRVRFDVLPFESPWFRDMGPIVGRCPAGDWIWFDSQVTRRGMKQRVVSDALPRFIAKNWKTRVAKTGLCIEGGSILSNGKGLTVCSTGLLETNRECGFDDTSIRRELRRVTGASTLFAAEPLLGEMTGHIDMFLTFTDPGTVVVGAIADPQDQNAKRLDRLANRLGELSVDGRKLRVVRLPMPAVSQDGVRTYTNVVYANGTLLVPSYPELAASIEMEVGETYRKLLPGWDIEFIDCTDLQHRGGAIHCIVSNLGDTPYTPMGRQLRVMPPLDD